MSRTQRIFDDPLIPMEMERPDRSDYNKLQKKRDRYDLSTKQYVGASCCPAAASYPCAACCTLNPLQCLFTCCCPT